MKICSFLIITTLFFFLIFFDVRNLIKADFCSPTTCPRDVNISVISTNISVEYPFRLKNQQNKSCGVPGFDLYCDNTLGPGTMIKLPNYVVLRVEYIYKYNNYVTVSDPSNCLPRKLMSLNLNNTPFAGGYTEKFWLYNCSNDDYFLWDDRIDCLSGSNYTVISLRYDRSDYYGFNCSLVKILSVPKSYYSSSYYYLNNISTIDLTWTGFSTPPSSINYESPTGSTKVGLYHVITGVPVAIIFILLCCCRYCKRRNAQVTSTTTSTTSAVAVVVGGLDQATIDSYPLTVLSESGCLLKSEDNTCSICLSEYEPRETVRMLPECVHRFHKECIDPWLRSKGVCPICRTSPHV